MKKNKFPVVLLDRSKKSDVVEFLKNDVSGVFSSLELVGEDDLDNIEKYYILVREDKIVLKEKGNPSFLDVDFLSGIFQKRLKTLSKSQPLFKAIGIREGLRVLDATAGLGKDALSFAFLGANVIAIEEHPAVFAILADGLRRAFWDSSFLSGMKGSIQILFGSSLEYISELTRFENSNLNSREEISSEQARISSEEMVSNIFLNPQGNYKEYSGSKAFENVFEKSLIDVIYLDPMYPLRDKTAKSKKEMTFLQGMLHETKSLGVLLEKSLMVAKERVVIKRPIKSDFVLKKPNHSFESKLVRFDMYLAGKRIGQERS